MKTVLCDFCDSRFDIDKRHVVALPRPSDPTELCAVMWACPKCGNRRDLPTAQELEEKIENGEAIGGTTYLFASL